MSSLVPSSPSLPPSFGGKPLENQDVGVGEEGGEREGEIPLEKSGTDKTRKGN